MRMEEIIAKALTKVNYDRYKLSLVAAKRAEDIAAGATILIDADKNKMKLVDIALLEIAEGKIKLEAIKEDN